MTKASDEPRKTGRLKRLPSGGQIPGAACLEMRHVGEVPKGYASYDTCQHKGRVFHFSQEEGKMLVTEVRLGKSVELVRLETGTACAADEDGTLACCSLGTRILVMGGRRTEGEVFAALVSPQEKASGELDAQVTILRVEGDKEWPNKACLCQVSKDQALLYFQRQNSIWRCTLSGKKLVMAKLSTCAPTKSGFMSVPIPFQDNALLVAGACPSATDIIILKMREGLEFKKIGDVPGAARHSTSAVLVGDRFVLGFGGHSGGRHGKEGDDVWIFDAQTNTSATVQKAGEWHPADSQVPLAVHDGELYLIGGESTTSISAISLCSLADLIQDAGIGSAFRQKLGLSAPSSRGSLGSTHSPRGFPPLRIINRPQTPEDSTDQSYSYFSSYSPPSSASSRGSAARGSPAPPFPGFLASLPSRHFSPRRPPNVPRDLYPPPGNEMPGNDYATLQSRLREALDTIEQERCVHQIEVQGLVRRIDLLSTELMYLEDRFMPLRDAINLKIPLVRLPMLRFPRWRVNIGALSYISETMRARERGLSRAAARRQYHAAFGPLLDQKLPQMVFTAASAGLEERQRVRLMFQAAVSIAPGNILPRTESRPNRFPLRPYAKLLDSPALQMAVKVIAPGNVQGALASRIPLVAEPLATLNEQRDALVAETAELVTSKLRQVDRVSRLLYAAENARELGEILERLTEAAKIAGVLGSGAEAAVAESVVEQAAELGARPSEKPSKKAAEKSTGKQAPRPAKRPAEEPPERHVENPTQEPAERPARHTAENPTEKAARKPSAKQSEKPPEAQAEQPQKKHAEKPKEGGDKGKGAPVTPGKKPARRAKKEE